MKYWIFTDSTNQEFSTTKFASVMGSLALMAVVIGAIMGKIESASLIELLASLGALITGTAVIRRVAGGTDAK